MKISSLFLSLTLILAECLGASLPSDAKEVAKTKIVLATWDWAPYYARELPDGGAATEIVEMSFRRAGYELQVEWVPWARAIEKAKEGEYDGVLGCWYTDERAGFFSYSKPFLHNEIVFFKRRGEAIHYKSFRDVTAYRIGVTRNSGPHEWLKAKHFSNLDIVGDANLNIKKLMAKRFDLIADEKMGVLYILKHQYPGWKDALEILDPPLRVDNLHIMISKKNRAHQKIVSDFDRGLLEIRQDGTFQKILAKHGFNDKK